MAARIYAAGGELVIECKACSTCVRTENVRDIERSCCHCGAWYVDNREILGPLVVETLLVGENVGGSTSDHGVRMLMFGYLIGLLIREGWHNQ